MLDNLFDPGFQSTEEETTILLETDTLRIEKIVSWGQHSSDDFWYDQDEDEWVVLLEGHAILALDGNIDISLEKGEPFFLPAHVRHRVQHTSAPAIWLCVFSKNNPAVL